MKLLNEANLVYFSTCSSQSTKEGWLYKKGEVNRSFQKRWFVLKGNLLFYFDKPGDREPNGVIVLEGYTVELVDNNTEGHTFQIAFKGAANTRKYIMQAESHAVMEEWMRCITCASYDYMKLMVAELKSQLDDLTSQELANELADCKHRAGDETQHAALPELTSSASAPELKLVQAKDPQQKRHNPFDKGSTDSLDPFGQVPFDPEPAGVHSRLSVPPEAPARKKKGSPKLLRKALNSPKLTKKVEEPSKGKAQFYQLSSNIQPEPAPLILKSSNFLELHALYGQLIRNRLPQTPAEGNTATLIEF